MSSCIRLLTPTFAVLGVMIGLLTSSEARGASARPALLVQLSFNQVELVDDYTQAQRDQCAAAITKELARCGRDRFGYLVWATDPTTVPPGACRLEVYLFEQKSIVGASVWLAFRATPPQGPNFAFTVPDMLYASGDLNKPTQEPVRLQKRVTTVIGDLFRAGDFPTRLEAELLAQIPVASAFDLEIPNRVIRLPLSARELGADRESRLRAEFSLSAPARKAYLWLHPAQTDEWEKPVGCFLKEFEIAPEHGEEWKPVIESSYLDRDQASMRVFMLQFKPNPAVAITRNRVTELSEGGSP